MCKHWLILIGLLWCTWGLAAHSAEQKDCTLKRIAALELAVSASGIPLVPVTIKGSAASSMLLNTSNPFSTVTESAAKRLGLRVQALPSAAKVRSGKNSIKQFATAKDFELGQVQFKRFEFLVVPDDSYQTASEEAIGVLGSDILAHLDVELDVAKKKMNLYSQDHCPGKVVYWAQTYDATPIKVGQIGEMYFPMELEGKKIETVFSTGNTSTTLYTDVTKQLFGFDSHSPDIASKTDAAGRKTFHYRAMSLTSDNLQVVNADIYLVEQGFGSCVVTKRAGVTAYDGCLGLHPLQLGRDVLSKLHIYIATKEKVIYFTPTDEAPN